MAKKRKANKGGAFGTNKALKSDATVDDCTGDQPQSSGGVDGSAPASGAKANEFCFRSSLGVPFIVVSDRQLVASVPAPASSEWGEIMSLCNTLIKQWEARSVVLTADFEGEFTGLEGELVCATFQRTYAVDPKGLRPMPAGGVSRDIGMLIDMRSPDGVALVKRIMESDTVTKMIWGADGDVTSLRYTPALKPLGIQSANVVDAQLAFSTAEHRLGMAKMLQQVPAKMVAGLPDKDCMDFETPHSKHHRALGLPLDCKTATYAVDDLHRLDAVLGSQRPSSGSYLAAHRLTASFLSLLLQNPQAVSEAKLRQYDAMIKKKTGAQRVAVAVRTKRHLIAARVVGASCGDKFAALEAHVDQVLSDGGVYIPQDLSFGIENRDRTNIGTVCDVTDASMPETEKSKKKAQGKMKRRRKQVDASTRNSSRERGNGPTKAARKTRKSKRTLKPEASADEKAARPAASGKKKRIPRRRHAVANI